jgi:hypothetical protein
MKMTENDFNQLKEIIIENDNIHGLKTSDWVEQAKISGWSDKRMRWDMVWSVGREKRQTWFDKVYQYLDDDHIDTALRKIVQQMT